MKLAALLRRLTEQLEPLTEGAVAALMTTEEEANAVILNERLIPGMKALHVSGQKLGAILNNLLEVMPTFVAANKSELETLLQKLTGEDNDGPQSEEQD